MPDSYVEQLERDLIALEEFAEWVEYHSGQGETQLTREMFEDAVSRGEWEIDNN